MMKNVLALADYEPIARRHLPRMLYGFISGGAETNSSVLANQRSFGRYSLVPTILTDVSARQTTVNLFGQPYAAPFGIAPMGITSLCGYRADITLGRAAAAEEIPMILSASSLIPLETVRREAAVDWYQAYLPGDTARIDALVNRVQAAGFKTFVLTADVPVAANRENNLRSGFSVPLKPSARLFFEGLTHPSWLLGTFFKTIAKHGLPHFENMDAIRGAPILSKNVERSLGNRDQLTWAHIELIRKKWKGNLVIKGVLSPHDAKRAHDAGADAIIISNHGGRQLDSAVAPLQMLASIRAAAPSLLLMLDGGIRRGTDILKAMALGATFVFLGRPFLFAASIAGQAGVQHAITLLKSELSRDMALLGISNLNELSSSHLVESTI